MSCLTCYRSVSIGVVSGSEKLHCLGEGSALGLGSSCVLGGNFGQCPQRSSRAHTTVPLRPRVATTPAASSSLYARATVWGATSSTPARFRTGGSFDPTARTPESASSMMRSLNCSKSATALPALGRQLPGKSPAGVMMSSWQARAPPSAADPDCVLGPCRELDQRHHHGTRHEGACSSGRS